MKAKKLIKLLESLIEKEGNLDLFLKTDSFVEPLSELELVEILDENGTQYEFHLVGESVSSLRNNDYN